MLLVAALQDDSRFASIVESWQQRAAGWVGGEEKPLRFDLQFGAVELTAAGNSKILRLFPSSRENTGAQWRFNWESAAQVYFEWEEVPEPVARLHGELRARDGPRLSIDLKADGLPANLMDFDAIRLRVRGKGSFQLRALQPSITDTDDYSIEPGGIMQSAIWSCSFNKPRSAFFPTQPTWPADAPACRFRST